MSLDGHVSPGEAQSSPAETQRLHLWPLASEGSHTEQRRVEWLSRLAPHRRGTRDSEGSGNSPRVRPPGGAEQGSRGGGAGRLGASRSRKQLLVDAAVRGGRRPRSLGPVRGAEAPVRALAEPAFWKGEAGTGRNGQACQVARAGIANSHKPVASQM